VIAIRVARPVTAPHPRARRARALQPPPRPAVRRARWKPRLRSAHFYDAPPRVRRNVLDRIRLRSPRLSGGATFKTQRQLVAESLVFDRCRNERGSSTALTSAAIYRRISIPHLGFRYGCWSARGSLNAGVRVCAGGWQQARRAGRRGYTTFAERMRPGPIPNPRSTRVLHRPMPIHSPDGR